MTWAHKKAAVLILVTLPCARAAVWLGGADAKHMMGMALAGVAVGAVGMISRELFPAPSTPPGPVPTVEQ